MLEKIIYKNHENQIIESAKDGIYANYNDLRDYEWQYTERLDKVIGFTRGIVRKTIPLIIYCDTEEQGIALKNKLMEIAEKDVISKTPGKLFINGFYMSGYIIGSTKSEYLISDRYMKVSLTFITNHKFWIKETPYLFSSNGIISSNNKGYEGRYPYRYANGMNNTYIINPNYVPSNFRMIIYGPVVNPQVIVGGIPYLVNIVLEEGEYLEIDSINETIVKVMRNGTRVNAFHNRAKGRAFFVKIPSGRNTITWPGNFAFDLIIFEERSEPKWNESK